MSGVGVIGESSSFRLRFSPILLATSASLLGAVDLGSCCFDFFLTLRGLGPFGPLCFFFGVSDDGAAADKRTVSDVEGSSTCCSALKWR